MNPADVQLLAAQFEEVLRSVKAQGSTVRSGSTVVVTPADNATPIKFHLTAQTKLASRTL